MIVAEQKPLQDIKSMLKDCDKVLAVGCGTCVTVCFAGGSKELAVLSSALRLSAGVEGKTLEVDELVVQRQCENEFIEPLANKIETYDAILSLGCGVGVQTLAERYPGKKILPALNTTFMGAPTELGVWEERCIGCGNCLLHLTGGICPITRCAKQLLNGPCGGSENGACEVDENTPCAWAMIWKQVNDLGEMDELMKVEPPKDWSTSRDGGPRRIVRDDLHLPNKE